MSESRVSAGSKLTIRPSASFRNDTISCVEDWQRRRQLGTGGRKPEGGPPKFDIVKVRNNTGSNLRRGEVVELGPFLLTHTDLEQQYRWFSGLTPDMTRAGWGVTIEPIPAETETDPGDIGEVLCVGTCIAFVNIINEDHKFANRKAGESVLESASSGPVKLLHKPTGSVPSERECVVQLVDESGDIVDTLQVYHEDKDPGEIVEANESNLHPGRIRRFNEEDGMEILEDVWIGFTDRFDQWQGDVLAVQEEFYGPGRRNGSFTVGESEEADTRPLYLVTHGEKTWDAFAYDEIVAGEAHLVEFLEWDDTEEKFMPTGKRWDAQDFFLNEDETQEAGTKLQVKWKGPRLVITAMYCAKSDDADIEATLPSEE